MRESGADSLRADARYIGIDAEEALRLATRKFRRRFEAVENRVRANALEMKSLSRDDLLALWQEAKADLGAV